MFDLYIGIDYSGRGTPLTRTPALQVYAAFGDEDPRRIESPSCTEKKHKNWCRKEIAEWLILQANKDIRLIVGLDHGFSFPVPYFKRHGLMDWDAFLDDFCQHWPTDQDQSNVDSIRYAENPTDRTGTKADFRVSEKWTSSAKSVFHFDIQGQVAKSTHTGIPWLRRIRDAVGEKVHFWPFNGWEPDPTKSVFVEVYPSILRNRYPRGDRTPDQQDAYCTARWLSEMDGSGFLGRYFNPPLNEKERIECQLEGWIFGVM